MRLHELTVPSVLRLKVTIEQISSHKEQACCVIDANRSQLLHRVFGRLPGLRCQACRFGTDASCRRPGRKGRSTFHRARLHHRQQRRQVRELRRKARPVLQTVAALDLGITKQAESQMLSGFLLHFGRHCVFSTPVVQRQDPPPFRCWGALASQSPKRHVVQLLRTLPPQGGGLYAAGGYHQDAGSSVLFQNCSADGGALAPLSSFRRYLCAKTSLGFMLKHSFLRGCGLESDC